MDSAFCQKQTADKPLFPDMLWSKPGNKRHAGRLLMIGGNLHGFAAAAEAYAQATKAGVGVARVLLPSALQKTVGRIFENGQYAPSTPSGSFSQQALAEWLEQGAWADGVLIAGDLGHNSETAVIFEKFLSQYEGQVTLAKDAVDFVVSNPAICSSRVNTALVLTFAQLQKLITVLKYPRHIESTMGLPNLTELLNDFSQTHKFHIITNHLEQIIVAVDGQVSTTKSSDNNWQTVAATHTAVSWLQNPNKTFEALTTAIIDNKS